jgi:hypothetical protein
LVGCRSKTSTASAGEDNASVDLKVRVGRHLGGATLEEERRCGTVVGPQHARTDRKRGRQTMLM